jgi:hypothetical protein
VIIFISHQHRLWVLLLLKFNTLFT